MSSLVGKNVLVTGGCGSIGSQIVSQLMQRGVNLIRVIDNNEQAIGTSYGSDEAQPTDIEWVLANVRDRESMIAAVKNIDVIFHTAAIKHVPVVEYNPYEGVKTNIDGTKNVLEAARKSDVDRLLFVSTDKAATPISAMGATKMLGERMVTAFDERQKSEDLIVGSVRLGNVLGTKGSVVPVFRKQIKSGGPITVTDPEMTRFIMSPSEASEYIINSCTRMSGGEIFVKKMSGIRVGDLARVMREHYAPQFGFDRSEIDIDIIGTRLGERHHELLVSRGELRYTQEQAEQFILYPTKEMAVETTNTLNSEYASDRANLLSDEALINMITTVLEGPNKKKQQYSIPSQTTD